MLLKTISILLLLGPVLSTELCKKSEWFDDMVGKCRKCKTCVDKLWEAAPCTAFMDTMCVDLKEISRSMAKSIKAGELSVIKDTEVQHSKQRWHEMEGPDQDINSKEASVSKDVLRGPFAQWDMLLVSILCILFLFFVILIIIGTVKFYGNPLQWDHSKFSRSRLFSRDRLNTTEYMNNLATLDRRLAIDEILEKKRRAAIFEPQLLKENIYTDEVFVDISGLPRNVRNSHHDYEEIDHNKCLLEMRDQQ